MVLLNRTLGPNKWLGIVTLSIGVATVQVAGMARDEEERGDALETVRWFLEYAMASTATSWSMEQVPTPAVRELLESYRAAGSPWRNKVAYHVVDFSTLGVPRNHWRLSLLSTEISPCPARGGVEDSACRGSPNGTGGVDDKVPGWSTSIEGATGLLLSPDETKLLLLWELVCFVPSLLLAAVPAQQQKILAAMKDR